MEALIIPKPPEHTNLHGGTFTVFLYVAACVEEKERWRQGRAVAQAGSPRLPTAAALVRGRVRSCGIYGGQSGIGAGFIRVIRFPLPNIPTDCSTLVIIRGWYNRPFSGISNSGLSSIPPQDTKKKQKKQNKKQSGVKQSFVGERLPDCTVLYPRR
jgi:hypothetical protein